MDFLKFPTGNCQNILPIFFSIFHGQPEPYMLEIMTFYVFGQQSLTERQMEIKRIGVIAKEEAAKAIEVSRKIVHWLQERGLEAVFPSDIARVLGEKEGYTKTQIPSLSDILIVLGGDGTLLSAARVVEDHDVPILGVNIGGLGFLTEITLDELFPALEEIIKGNYEVEERVMLRTHIHRQDERIAQYRALNDVVINKGALARIIELEMSINDQYVNTYLADGLILSSPTGSTAYSMSAGGPIVHPSLHSITVTPICAHALTKRPIVVPDTSSIKVILNTKGGEVLLTLDGQVGFALSTGDCVEIRKADHTTKLIRSPYRTYFDILREKLGWG